MATDGNQSVVWTTTSQPFGQISNAPTTIAQDLRMPGQESDLETGLYHNGFRDYVPGSGRYVESDPAGLAGGSNRYAYADGNPTGETDPHGLDSTWQMIKNDYAAVNSAYDVACNQLGGACGVAGYLNTVKNVMTSPEIPVTPPSTPPPSQQVVNTQVMACVTFQTPCTPAAQQQIAQVQQQQEQQAQFNQQYGLTPDSSSGSSYFNSGGTSVSGGVSGFLTAGALPSGELLKRRSRRCVRLGKPDRRGVGLTLSPQQVTAYLNANNQSFQNPFEVNPFFVAALAYDIYSQPALVTGTCPYAGH